MVRDGTLVIVATSKLEQDNAVFNLALMEKVYCFRGSETDVLDRYYNTAKKYRADFIIRATGDNPFVNPIEAARVLVEIESGYWDYVSMFKAVEGKKLPKGVGVEAFKVDALERSWLEAKELHHREHVNEYILENPSEFRIRSLHCMAENSCKDLSLTIDTLGDLKSVENMLDVIARPALELSTEEIISWWKRSKK